jgi:hypothetical protein
MSEEEDLKNGIEEIAVELGQYLEKCSYLLSYDEMVELALRAVMNELRIPNEGKLDILRKATISLD